MFRGFCRAKTENISEMTIKSDLRNINAETTLIRLRLRKPEVIGKRTRQFPWNKKHRMCSGVRTHGEEMHIQKEGDTHTPQTTGLLHTAHIHQRQNIVNIWTNEIKM